MHRLLIAVVLCSFGCSSDDTETTERATPCSQLRDHLVDLRLDGIAGTPQELAQHRAAMMQALGPDFLASCNAAMTPSEIACATQASDLAAASECSTAQGR